MKKVLLMIAMVLVVFAVRAQDYQDIPENVTSSLHERYPDISMEDVDWEMKDFQYKAEFEKEGKGHEVLIDPMGNWVSTEIEMNKKDLPKGAKKSLKNEFGRGAIGDEVKLRETPEETLYKVEIDVDDADFDVVYLDEEGNIVERASS